MGSCQSVNDKTLKKNNSNKNEKNNLIEIKNDSINSENEIKNERINSKKK